MTTEEHLDIIYGLFAKSLRLIAIGNVTDRFDFMNQVNELKKEIEEAVKQINNDRANVAPDT